MALLELKNVSYSSDNKMILNDISVSIEKGDYISIVGPSGSGKSTFLKLCSCLISPTAGDIFYNNKSINEYNPVEYRKMVSYCFQTPYLFGDTVYDNISFPYIIRSKHVDMENVKMLLSTFKLDESCLNEKVINLSGGEKQRIALIRSLLFKPDMLLLDEVTSALDVDNTIIVEDVIKLLNDEGLTILLVTHNPEQSKKHANKLLTIEGGKLISEEALR
jgi:putative ABC transport system ATP-binding protein